MWCGGTEEAVCPVNAVVFALAMLGVETLSGFAQSGDMLYFSGG